MSKKLDGGHVVKIVVISALVAVAIQKLHPVAKAAR